MSGSNEPMELAVRTEGPTGTTTPAIFGTNDPAEIIQRAARVAQPLADMIDKCRLYSNIQGKKYPRVEAWTTLGSMLGIFPVVAWTRPNADGSGWEARVEAKTLGGHVVGAAEAQCTRDEKMWKGRDDYALRSMAQTRATAKALRLPLGFVIALAGYESTPAEELSSEPSSPAPPPRAAPHEVAEFHRLIAQLGTPAEEVTRKLRDFAAVSRPDDLNPSQMHKILERLRELANTEGAANGV